MSRSRWLIEEILESPYEKVVKLGIDGNEHMIVLDDEGNILATVHDQNPGGVDLPNTPEMLDRSSNLTAIHNHPDNSNLSYRDLQAFEQRPGLKRLVAVAHDGTIHTAERISGKERELARRAEDIYYELKERLKEEMIYPHDAVTPEIRSAYFKALIDQSSLLPQQLADEGLMKYSRS